MEIFNNKAKDTTSAETIEIGSESIKGYKRRDGFERICRFIDSDTKYHGKILAIYGLRRTGKTTLMQQTAEKYGSDKCIIMQCSSALSMDKIYNDIDIYQKNGKTVIMLDEITDVPDFISDATALADIYAKRGLSIIIAGTDSLGLSLAHNEAMLGRMPEVRTTYISFAEHSRVLDTKNIDDYIRFGGLMRAGTERDDDDIVDIRTARRYLDSAVTGNIVRSLAKYEDAGGPDILPEIRKYSLPDLEKIINKLVMLYSGEFKAEAVNKQDGHNIIDYPIQRFRATLDPETRQYITENRVNINREYAEKINAACELSVPATKELMDELSKVLGELEVASYTKERIYSIDENGGWTKEDAVEHHVIQPAIKYYQLKEAWEEYKTSSFMQNLSEKDKALFGKKTEEKILGDMTENIVVFDTQHSLDQEKYSIYKPKFYEGVRSVGEYDMLVFNKEDCSYYGFEVKHTSQPTISSEENDYEGQDKNLINDTFTKIMDADFGKRNGTAVLYNGESFQALNGTIYLNLSDFLLSIDKTKDIDKTMEELCIGLKRDEIITEKVRPGAKEYKDIPLKKKMIGADTELHQKEENSKEKEADITDHLHI